MNRDNAKGDKPRKIIVCSIEDYPRVQQGVTRDLGHSDVLVQPNRLVPQGTAYVMDGRAIDLPERPYEPTARWVEEDRLMAWKRASS